MEGERVLAIEFFARHSGLCLSEKAKSSAKIEAVCDSCGRTGDCIQMGLRPPRPVCLDCIPLRQQFSAPGDTLAGGRFALIAENRLIYWVKFNLDGWVARPFEQRAPVLEDLLRLIVFEPPKEPYLVVLFEPSNRASTFALNAPDRDYVHLGGAGMMLPGGLNVSGFNRRPVVDLITTFPEMKGEDWNRLIRGRHLVLTGENTAKDLEVMRQMFERNPDLSQVDIPRFGSPEAYLLTKLA